MRLYKANVWIGYIEKVEGNGELETLSRVTRCIFKMDATAT
jgi:hypothetical protein